MRQRSSLRTVFGLLMLASTFMSAQAATVLANSTELLETLVKGQQSVALVFLQPDRGCVPARCSTVFRDLAVWQDKGGGLAQKGGKRLTVLTHALRASVALPELDWNPLEVYAVTTVGEDWGMCLEFAHAGVGKSGARQRWRSVVLVPRATDTSPLGPTAHRFMGYWASCSVLAAGSKLGEMVLPVLESADDQGRLTLVWHRCAGQRCTATVDGRAFVPMPGSDTGALVLTDVTGR